MKVAKWGNSLAVRLPVAVVEALGLSEGDEIEIRAEDRRTLVVNRKPDIEELLARVRKLRGAMPSGFRFDREAANER